MSLFILRVIQIGLSLADLDFLSYGQVMDMFIEAGNDDCQYDQLASQADMDRF